MFAGSLASCLEHDLTHEVLTGAEVNRRFPGYQLPHSHMAVFQPDGGYVMSEKAIVAHVESALGYGAEVHGREQVMEWEPRGDGVRVGTDRGQYTADRMVVTAGAWSMGLVDLFRGKVVPERQVLAWFQPEKPELFQRATFPVFNLEVEEGHFYGFPVESVPGFKIGLYHHLREDVDPETMDRDPHPVDELPLRQATEKYFPRASGPTLSLKTCLFTNTPDEHFVVDIHPDFNQIVVGAGFSGHGFKFAAVIGEVLADLATTGSTSHNIDLLRSSRLG